MRNIKLIVRWKLWHREPCILFSGLLNIVLSKDVFADIKVERQIETVVEGSRYRSVSAWGTASSSKALSQIRVQFWLSNG